MVWFLALRGHASGSGEQPASGAPATSSTHSPGAASSASASASAGTAGDRSPGAPSKVYHGSAPGLEGLTRDINKAHGAVATSERNAAQLQRDSAKASGEAPQGTNGAHAAASHAAASHTVSAASSSAAAVHTHVGPAAAPGRQHAGSSAVRRSSRGARRHAGRGPSSHRSSGSKTTTANGRAPQQIEVEREIAQGKTVLLLFWEPRSTVDNTVRQQVLALGKSSKGRLAVNVALADQVGLFGPVTEVAHVYETPTILIINRHGLVTTLTGLVDQFFLRQAVREAQHANR